MPKKNKKYYVTVEEKTAVTYEVKANSVAEAREKVLNGECDMVEQDHVGTDDPNDWEIELAGDEE